MDTNNVHKRLEKKTTNIRLPGRNTQSNMIPPPINNGNEKGRTMMFHTWWVD